MNVPLCLCDFVANEGTAVSNAPNNTHIESQK
jgi:hypothetical protein